MIGIQLSPWHWRIFISQMPFSSTKYLVYKNVGLFFFPIFMEQTNAFQNCNMVSVCAPGIHFQNSICVLIYTSRMVLPWFASQKGRIHQSPNDCPRWLDLTFAYAIKVEIYIRVMYWFSISIFIQLYTESFKYRYDVKRKRETQHFAPNIVCI